MRSNETPKPRSRKGQSKGPRSTKKKTAIIKKKNYDIAQIQRALELMNDGKTASEAYRETSIPRTTLNGWKSSGYTKPEEIKTSGRECYFTESVEQELREWVLLQAKHYWTVYLDQFILKVNQFMERLDIPFRGDQDTVTRSYIRSFLKRNPDLDSMIVQNIDNRRIKNSDPNVIRSFYTFVQNLCEQKNIKTFFNLDESGFSGEATKKAKRKGISKSRKENSHYRAQSR